MGNIFEWRKNKKKKTKKIVNENCLDYALVIMLYYKNYHSSLKTSLASLD